LLDLNNPNPKVDGTGICCTTCNNMTLTVELAEEIPDIFTIFIACSKAVSDGFELSNGTSILLYVISSFKDIHVAKNNIFIVTLQIINLFAVSSYCK
jgi:hypothetical protein